MKLLLQPINIVLYSTPVSSTLSRAEAAEFADLIKTYKHGPDHIDVDIHKDPGTNGHSSYHLALRLPITMRDVHQSFAAFVQAIANDYGYGVVVNQQPESKETKKRFSRRKG